MADHDYPSKIEVVHEPGGWRGEEIVVRISPREWQTVEERYTLVDAEVMAHLMLAKVAEVRAEQRAQAL